MFSISISHRNAPVSIRERFAFTIEEAVGFSQRAKEEEDIGGCVVVSTCNRNEVYFTGSGKAIEVMEGLLAKEKEAEEAEVLQYYNVYTEERAAAHLFKVASGMDSMVIGEDEILGQIKNAYQAALLAGTTDYELNTVFQNAMASSKRIKTDTMISKTAVSIGTLAANEVFRFGSDHNRLVKQVLIIGITGKMGMIIMKNLCGKQDIQIVGTSRSHHACNNLEVKYENVKVVDYLKRYEYIEEADIIISATASPHYTVTAKELKGALKTRRPRLFIDLAVPNDIDRRLEEAEEITLYNIDYFETLAEENNKKKKKKVKAAGKIMHEDLEDTLKELFFHKHRAELKEMKEMLSKKSWEQNLFKLKDLAELEELKTVFSLFDRLREGM